MPNSIIKVLTRSIDNFLKSCSVFCLAKCTLLRLFGSGIQQQSALDGFQAGWISSHSLDDGDNLPNSPLWGWT